jgi:hypothetical protein
MPNGPMEVGGILIHFTQFFFFYYFHDKKKALYGRKLALLHTGCSNINHPPLAKKTIPIQKIVETKGLRNFSEKKPCK